MFISRKISSKSLFFSFKMYTMQIRRHSWGSYTSSGWRLHLGSLNHELHLVSCLFSARISFKKIRKNGKPYAGRRGLHGTWPNARQYDTNDTKKCTPALSLPSGKRGFIRVAIEKIDDTNPLYNHFVRWYMLYLFNMFFFPHSFV